MPDSVHEMSRTIGALEASVTNLTETWQRQDREATEGRRRLHEKVDALKSQQEALASTVRQQAEQLAEVVPAIDRFEAQRQRQEGAHSAGKLIWMAIVTFATGLGYVAHELLMFLWPPKH